MKTSIKLFTYKNTPIYLSYWFFLIFLFLSPIQCIILFFSVLIHEMAHTIIANKLKYKTDYITIGLLFGAAMIDNKYLEDDDHRIAISIAGPLSNILLAIIFFIIGIIHYIFLNQHNIIINNIALINIILGLINLLPIYPLDGGRISKSLFHKMISNKNKAKQYSSILSMFTCLVILLLSLFYGLYFIALFCLFLGYVSYLDTKK